MSEGQIGRIIFARLLEDEDLVEAVKKRVEKSGVKTGLIIAIGSLKTVVMGYYKEGQYKYIRLGGPLEIASCTGNIAVDENGETIIHAHIVVTNENGEAFGGHLMQGSIVGATAELTIIEGIGLSLQRTFDDKTKLKILRLS